MKTAIMSDVHANPSALETALADARAQGCERFLFLGDVTGYGYDAKTALGMVRENFEVALLGNHDSACLGRETSPADLMNPNYDLDRAQRGQLTKTELKWLAGRRFLRIVDRMALAHGNFVSPASWGYVIDERDALVSFLARRERLMFCGHTHHVAVWRRSRSVAAESLAERRFRVVPSAPESIVFRRKRGERYIVNVGSVGYPRNDLCSTYAICDPASDEFTIRRLPFDFAGYVREMLSRGIMLPDWLCELLLAVRKSGRSAKATD